MPTVDTKSSLVVVKQFLYRGATRTWANRYHFSGAVTLTAGEWEAFSDAVVAAEHSIFPSDSKIIKTIGNDASTATSTNPHGLAVFEKTYSTNGTYTDSNALYCPGDCAAILRYSTTQRTSRNHPIYLFNYFHNVMYRPSTGVDFIIASQVGAINTYGAAWISGFSDGTHTLVRCGPRGAVAQSRVCHDWVAHRDFPN